MNITNKRNQIAKVEFKELCNGTVFEYGGIICMVMGPVETALGSIHCNAVTLSHGLPKRFNGSDMVFPLCCNLVVEDY